MKLHLRMPLIVATRRASAVMLSLALGTWSSFTYPQVSKALGIDGGSIGATGGMIDCSDSGVLVATAGPGKTLGTCPLKHTDVHASVSGYVARVTVKQQFHNPFKQKIEATYTFPMPENAAVDEMTMRIGNRVIKGTIKKKEEARQTYETAKAQGHVASLLDQERPNIFTQAVANIEPGQNIDIEIHYVNILKYENGSFTFAFPTVVGPRFMPGNIAEGRRGTGTESDTDLVPDASKISPPMKAEGERAGHDISIDLDINAGVPIQSVQSKLHDVQLDRPSANLAHLKLKDKDKIPNKDFVATWNVAADSIQSGYLAHKKGNEGFFTLMLIPPKRVTPATVQPKEMVFLLDCSGSQGGRPIQKAKETMEYIVDHMNPKDTFQVVTFNNGTTFFAENPVAASAKLREDAKNFIAPIQAHGGTWAAPAVEKVCAMPAPENRLRIVTFMTDGFVGNDMEIIDIVKRYRGKSRWFTFGTGNSVNRFMIDNIAKEGGGEADYVLLNSSAEEVGKKFYEHISSPVLTDISVDFDGLDVKEVFPREPADVWAQRPVFITGRYSKGGKGKVILKGFSGGKPYKQELKVTLPDEQKENDVLPSIWARAKVDRLMAEDWRGVQYGQMKAELRDEVEQTALKYHIMSQFTSFVAVEETRKTSDGPAVPMTVPVESPDGVNTDGLSRYGRKAVKRMSAGMMGAPWATATDRYSHYQPSARIAGGGGSGNGGSGSGGGGGGVGMDFTSSRSSAWYKSPSANISAAPTPHPARAGMPSTNSAVRGSVLPQTTLSSVVKSGGFSNTTYGDEGQAQSFSGRLDNQRQLKGASRSQIQEGSGFNNAGQDPGTSQLQAWGGKALSNNKSRAFGIPTPLAPSPMSTPSASSKPSSGFYTAPKQTQVLDDRPIVRDFREAKIRPQILQLNEQQKKPDTTKKEEFDKNTSALASVEKEKTSKLVSENRIDAKLQAALKEALNNKQTRTRKLKIRLKLSGSPGSDLLDRLNKVGLKVEKRDADTLVGNINAHDLVKLLNFSEVKYISLAD